MKTIYIVSDNGLYLGAVERKADAMVAAEKYIAAKDPENPITGWTREGSGTMVSHGKHGRGHLPEISVMPIDLIESADPEEIAGIFFARIVSST